MKISIVTPSYNQADFLGDTIRSVLEQEGDFELEYIIIDGGSTDGSVDLLRAIDDPRVQWVSEPDGGQSDAINRGFQKATGSVLAWLNSDDLYVPGALHAAAQGLALRPEAAWLTGACPIIDQAGQPIRPWVTRYKNHRLRRYTYARLLCENFISQPATFWRAEAWAQTGPLDTNLHWTMDYDLWLRLGQLSAPCLSLEPLAQFRLYATSKTGDFTRKQYDEGYNVAQRYLGNSRFSRYRHRAHLSKILWAYRLLKMLGK